MKRLFYLFLILFTFDSCLDNLISPPSSVRAQSEGYKRTQDALRKDEPGAKERAISDLQECRDSLTDFDSVVHFKDSVIAEKDKKIASLEQALAKCNKEKTELAQDSGFKDGVEWIAYVVIAFLILLTLIYLIVSGKLKVSWMG